MKQLLCVLLAATVFVSLSSPAWAAEISGQSLILGDNITIFDENGSTSDGSNVGFEDGETEPGMVNSQAWDLEGFFLDQKSLSMVGGFNFATGEEGFTSGDIFIAVGEKPVYGDIHLADNNDVNSALNGNEPVFNTYGYDYVLDLDFGSDTDTYKYTVFAIDKDTTLRKAFYQLNEGSSPWQYVSGGDEIDTGTFSFLSGLTDTGFGGTTHYALTGFDLSFLDFDAGFYTHFTMGCGNDNLMGRVPAPVPEPSTFLLFGLGGGLLWLARRRKSRQ